MLFRLVPYLVDYKTQNTIYFATKSKLASIALITICKLILWLSNLLSNRLRSYKLLKLWDYALKLEIRLERTSDQINCLFNKSKSVLGTTWGHNAVIMTGARFSQTPF